MSQGQQDDSMSAWSCARKPRRPHRGGEFWQQLVFVRKIRQMWVQPNEWLILNDVFCGCASVVWWGVFCFSRRLVRLPHFLVYSTRHPIRKRAIRKEGWDLQVNKKLGSRYTEVSLERTHSQIRNPTWTSFTVSYLQKNKKFGSTGYLLIIRKRAIRKEGGDLQLHKKFGSHYTEVSLERTHSQIINPAWVSLPVS